MTDPHAFGRYMSAQETTRKYRAERDAATARVDLAEMRERCAQLISQHDRLRADNGALRGRIARLEAENRKLADKVRLAADRLEGLLDKLPEA